MDAGTMDSDLDADDEVEATGGQEPAAASSLAVPPLAHNSPDSVPSTSALSFAQQHARIQQQLSGRGQRDSSERGLD